MGEILGVGLSHFPGFIYPDADMAMRVKQNLQSTRVPAELKDPRSWPAPMQAEWGEDEGATFAEKHREQFLADVRRLRAAIDSSSRTRWSSLATTSTRTSRRTSFRRSASISRSGSPPSRS